MGDNHALGARALAAPPTVSVVIPCFNQAGYLPAAIDSVRRQSHPPAEIIVVNDGSTDHTSALAATLGARVLTQPNRGLPEARNTGLAAAAGEYVVLVDADDELLPRALELGLAALQSRPEAVAAVGRCRLIDADGRELPATYHPIDHANLYREWLSRNFGWTPGAAIFRRDAVLRAGGFPPGLGGSADYAVYLRLARTSTVVCHAGEVVKYRQHAASMSRDPILMLRHTLEVLRRERAEAPPHMRRDIARGVRVWRRWYGEHMVERLRTDWRARRFGWTQFRNLAWLVWHCPALALRQPFRRLRRVLGGQARWSRPEPTGTDGRGGR
jgi:glycosyltransferase involved in cell wall biosynthesis